jgi:hypothetical protein
LDDEGAFVLLDQHRPVVTAFTFDIDAECRTAVAIIDRDPFRAGPFSSRSGSISVATRLMR